MKRLLSTLIICIIAVGCNPEHDASIVAILIDPSAEVLSSGEKMYFDLEVTTLNNSIETIEVTSFDPISGIQEILSVTPKTKSFQTKVIYEAPAMEADTTIVELYFKAVDDTGYQSELSYPVKVVGGTGSLLPEISSIVLYSPLSGKPDAFSFKTMQPLLSSSAAKKDLDMCLNGTGQENGMPLDLVTRTDVVFSRANNFDYSAATWTGVQSVFKNSIRSSHVSTIAVDDVILVGREERTDSTYRLETVGVFKVMALYDEPGSESDRIVFNLKTLNR